MNEEVNEKSYRQRRLVSYTSYDSPFVYFFEEMKNIYPEELFNIQGISAKARDLNEFSKRFFSKSAETVSDLTVDKNANVAYKTVSQYTSEHNKANQRLNGLYLLWKYIKKGEIASGKTEEQSIEIANACIEKVIIGEIFVNDLNMVEKPYCWAQSLEHLVFNGMDFLTSTNMNIKAPKHSFSFINLVIQYVAYTSNQCAGAIALPDLFVYLDWFYRKEHGEDYIERMKNDTILRKQITNQLQHLIYSLNFEFRTGR